MSDPITTIQTAASAANSISSFLDAISTLAPKVVTVAAVLAAIIPPQDPKVHPTLAKLDKFLDYFAFNIGHAKNKTPTIQSDTPPSADEH